MPYAGLKVSFTVGFVAWLAGCASQPVASGDRHPENHHELMYDIRQSVAGQLPKITPCYEKAIEDRPGAAGKIVVNWQLGADGVPADVLIKESDASLKAAEPCVLDVVRALRFKAREGGETLDIVYPFYFSENGRYLKTKEEP